MHVELENQWYSFEPRSQRTLSI